MIKKSKETNLISFPLTISSTNNPSLFFFFPWTESQTVLFRTQTKVTSSQLQDSSSWTARNCNAQVQKYLLPIKHFLAVQIRSAQGFSNVTQHKCSRTLPSCIGVIWSVFVLARASLMAISSLWLPTPIPSCAELLLSLCSPWEKASSSWLYVPGKSKPCHKSFSSKI